MKNYNTLSKEEKLLILLQLYVEKLKQSGFDHTRIMRYMWLFCVGYYIKYYLPDQMNSTIDRFTIIYMLSDALKCSSKRIIDTLGFEHELTYFFRYLIHYAIDNEQEAEGIYQAERVKYEKSVLLSQVSPNKKKRKGKGL
ncbi:hypothetical protein [Pantoea agglomerans]|uniref:hypothetical protein n=1 Tax=Enterobacter agglomerans TaxID=549 RepID=UPI002A6B1C0F|nr:hypothetical protein [Pantoea agglomerans]MDY0900063.1 hypothetical protein [Pantoea agglomerans]